MPRMVANVPKGWKWAVWICWAIGRWRQTRRLCTDIEEVRLQKALMVAGSLMFTFAGALWGILYILLEEPLAGAIPISYAFISLISILFFGITRRYRFFRFSQLGLILLLPFILMIALGGFIN